MSLQSFFSSLLNVNSRFYCHCCEVEFVSHVSDPACPHCHSPFVEALEDTGESTVSVEGTESSQTLATGSEGEKGEDGETKEKSGARMEVDDDDPEPEVINRHQSRGQQGFSRRSGSPTFRFPPGEPLVTITVPRQRPLAVQLHEHIENLMADFHRRDRETASQEEETDTDRETGPSGRETDQTGPETGQAGPETGQTGRETGQTGRETNQTGRETNQGHPTLAQSSSGEQGASRGASGSNQSRGPATFNLQFSMGSPWWFMLRDQQGPRRQESPLVMGFGAPGAGSDEGRLHGSMADYAWGPQGLDNIISQMLTSLDDPGPPPASKDKIEALPMVEATDKILEDCSMCSVCKEPFTVRESLMQMPCSHVYHEDCLLPWLKLHDTCPTCRYHLNTEKRDDCKSPV